MSRIRILSTDFDGTLVGFARDSAHCPDVLAEALVEFKRAGGLWAVNTGRSLDHAIEGVEKFGAPVSPDFLLTNERDIFYAAEIGEWEAHDGWNSECRRRHDDLFSRSEGMFRHIEDLSAGSPEITIIYEERFPAGLVTADEMIMERVAASIDQAKWEFPEFNYQRNAIYMRFCHRDYDKGSSLAELCRREGVARDEVLAVGDHFNDIPMLDGRHAALVGCPDNAIFEVKSAVGLSGGRVATSLYGSGVAEILSHFAGL